MDKFKNKIDNNFHWIFYGRKFFCNNINVKKNEYNERLAKRE